ncbi:50S ribosomal protein L21 [Chloroflexota bacterium]
MYAIIETGGKQYKITEGQTIDVEHLDMAEGSNVELDRVLLISDGEKISVGKPVIDGAKVLATLQQNGKEAKVIVFKYKPKVRYRRKNGHRQLFTRLTIDSIMLPGASEEKPVKKTTRRRKKEVTEDGT